MLNATMIKHIDIKSTIKNVNALLKRYNYLIRVLPERTMPKITQSYNSIPASTVRSLNAIERSAYENLKREKLIEERNQLKELLFEIVEQLNEDEKYIIINKFLSDNETSDYDIYYDLCIGKTKYYQLKKEALLKLALLLGLEIYKE